MAAVFAFLAMALVAGTLTPAVALETRVIKLRQAIPSQISGVLRQTFGTRLRVAEVPTINAVVLASEQEALIIQAEALIRELDQPPAMLKFSIRLLADQEATEWQAGAGNLRANALNWDAQIRNSRDQGREVRSVTGVEGMPVGLTDETTRIETYPSPYGPQTLIRKSSRGLKATGRLVGDQEAIVELSYAEGGENSANQVLTQVRARLGEWFYLGDIDQGGDDAGSGVSVSGDRGHATWRSRRSRGSRNYLLKVDKVK